MPELVHARRNARAARPRRAVRPARADVPCPLDARPPRRDRPRPLRSWSLRQRRLALGGLVPPRGVGPLAENGIYNLKSLTALLGPMAEVLAAEAVAVPDREAGGTEITAPDPDVCHVVLRHAAGAISSAGLVAGDPALPPAGARAVRRRGHGEPARRRLGPARRRGVAQRRRPLGGARADRRHLALGRRPARVHRGSARGEATTPAARAGPAPARRRRGGARGRQRATRRDGRIPLPRPRPHLRDARRASSTSTTTRARSTSSRTSATKFDH